MGEDINIFFIITLTLLVFLFYSASFSLFFKNISAIYKYLIESGGTIVFLSLVQDGTIGFLYPA